MNTVFYEDTKSIRITNKKQAQEYVGKTIAYLTEANIDKSGRGYYFMRYAEVKKIVPPYFEDDNGNLIKYRDIVRIKIM